MAAVADCCCKERCRVVGEICAFGAGCLQSFLRSVCAGTEHLFYGFTADFHLILFGDICKVVVCQCKRNLEIHSGIIVLVRVSPACAGHAQQLDIGKGLAQQGHCLICFATCAYDSAYALDGTCVALDSGRVCRYPGVQFGFLLLLASDDVELREGLSHSLPFLPAVG